MSQRVDERKPTRVELDAYNKILELTDFVMSVCKPKEERPNGHHVPKRNASVGQKLKDAVIDMGSAVLEANYIYVGANLELRKRIKNYKDRIELQEFAKKMTFRSEHIFRVLHFDSHFAESTARHMISLIYDARNSLTAWRESETKALRRLTKQRHKILGVRVKNRLGALRQLVQCEQRAQR